MDGENNTTQFLNEPDAISDGNAEVETGGSSLRQAGGKRKHKDRRLGKYLDLVEVLIVAIEADQSISVINRKGCEILGYKKEELIGENWFDTCLLEKDRERMRAEFKRVLAGEIEPVRSGNLPVLTKSGEIRWLSWHNAELKNRKGEMTAALCSGEDITERIKAEEELKKAEERVRLKLKSLLSPEGRMGSLELADIIDAPAIQSLMEDFYDVAQVPIGIIDLKGKVLVGVGWQDICTRFHRVNPETCRHCIESDTQLSAGVRAGEFKLYKCRNNMWDAATPIIVGDRHVGNIFYGQFFFDDEMLDYGLFRSQARQRGFPEEEYIAALEAVPRLSRESLDTAMAFFTKLADMLSQLSYSNIKLARLLAERNSLMNSLKVAENKYRGIFENAIEGIFRTTPEGRVLDANPAFAGILGYDSPEEMKQAITDIGKQHYADPESRKKWISFIEKNNFGRFEVLMRRKNGSVCWVCLSTRPVRDAHGETNYYEGFAEDITDRKWIEEELKQYRDHLEILVKERTSQLEENNRLLIGEIAERKKVEEALRESENKYRTIFENTGTATLIYEENSMISLVNTEFEKMFHFTKEEVEGNKSWTAITLQEDFEWLMRYHHLRSIDPEAVPRNYELKVVDRYGHILDAYMTVAMIPGTKKRVASLLDITPLKKVERALAENEALYRNLFENASIGMFQMAFSEGRFLRVNKAYARMLGYESPNDLLANISDVAILQADPTDRADLIATLEKQDWYYGEYPRFRKDGSIMFGKVAIRRVLDTDGTIAYIEGIVEDITERRQAEEALRKNEKELRIKAQNLAEVNTTLKVLLDTMEKDQEELKQRILTNVKEQVLPYLDKLKKRPLQEVEKGFVQMAVNNLHEIASPFVRKLTSNYLNLTKKEVQIAALIKEGKTSKEIAELLNSNQRVILFHRENIRKKLGLKNRKENLQILLRQFS